MKTHKTDVLVLGAGAAGLFCAIHAAKRGRQVVVLEKSNKPGKKILMSGGGRCNFTNLHTSPKQFISKNPHFCKSALSRYTPQHFIELIESHGVTYHEKTLGQLFCDQKSKAILGVLLDEASLASVSILLNQEILSIEKFSGGFRVNTHGDTQAEEWVCESLVVATGGYSIPSLGSSGFGFDLARQFGLAVEETMPALVPFVLDPNFISLSQLSGVSLPVSISLNKIQFQESMLFTHRGLSGPAILQISSYWRDVQSLQINLLPNLPHKNLFELLKLMKQESPLITVKTALSEFVPKRLLDYFFERFYDQDILIKRLADCSHALFQSLDKFFHNWSVLPKTTEGYLTAEVTRGGVSCEELSSQTMEVKKIPGLFFIGEVLDVTGWLGGYNFQWAWASGFVAGQVA
jgi:hypothetical protein